MVFFSAKKFKQVGKGKRNSKSEEFCLAECKKEQKGRR